MKRTSPVGQLAHAFGFDPAESQHHFLVTVPRAAKQPVMISEHMTWDDETGSMVTHGTQEDGQIRVLLARPKWDGIAEEVRAEFNQRLRRHEQRMGSWKTGKNFVRRELGKELVLLAWALEDADPGLIANALANWKGLVPEERWWLYTQTAAATGHATLDRGRGWRKAVRFALTENPIGERAADRTPVPEFFRIAKQRSEQPLFEFAEDEA